MKKYFGIFLPLFLIKTLAFGQNTELKMIKSAMIEGNIPIANVLARRISHSKNHVDKDKLNFLRAQISFLLKDYSQAQHYIVSGKLQASDNFPHTCHLTTLLKVLNKDFHHLNSYWTRCKREIQFMEGQSQDWFQQFILLSSGQIPHINQASAREDEVLPLVKLNHYYHSKQPIDLVINGFTEEELKEPDFSELFSHHYFRQKKYRQAYQLIQNSKQIHAVLIKSSWALQMKQWDLAIETLEKMTHSKEYSPDIFQRLSYLYILKGQYQKALNALELSPEDPSQKRDLAILLQSKLGNIETAKEFILSKKEFEKLNTQDLLARTYLATLQDLPSELPELDYLCDQMGEEFCLFRKKEEFNSFNELYQKYHTLKITPEQALLAQNPEEEITIDQEQIDLLDGFE